MAFWSFGGHPGGKEDVCKPAKMWRAAQLQSRWGEVVERERRAWARNRQLLQDFRRAQDTLRDLAARTAAMETIRMEYERQLEHHFPQWQQRFEEKRIAAQQKEMQIVALQLKEALGEVEEKGKGKAHSRTAKGVNARMSSPGPSLLPNSPILPHSLTTSRSGETHLHLSHENRKVVKENDPFTPWNARVQSSWLTGGRSRTGVPQASIIQNLHLQSDPQGFQDLIRAGYSFQHPLLHVISQPFDASWSLPQGQPHGDLIMGYPPSWPGLCNIPRFQSVYSQVPWPGNPIVDFRDWGDAWEESTRRERVGSEGPESSKDSRQDQQRCKRQMRTSNLSYELDFKPVRLSSTQGHSSEDSSICSEAPQEEAARMFRMRSDKNGGIRQRGNREETASQMSSRVAFEARSQRNGMPLATALSTGEEESHTQVEASGMSGAEADRGINQAIDDGQEDSSQIGGGTTDEDVEEKTIAEEEMEGREQEMIKKGIEVLDVHTGEEGSEDEDETQGEPSSGSKDVEAEGMGALLKQAEEKVKVQNKLKPSAKDDGEEDPSSESNVISEEEEDTEEEVEEEEVEEFGSYLGQEEEEEEEEEEGEHENEEDEEGDGSCSLEKRDTDEGQAKGNDSVEEDEEDDEGEEGTGGTDTAESEEEESKGTTDSEDEIITSHLDKSNNKTRKTDTTMRCKTRAGGNIDDIEEEEEDKDVEQIAEDENRENESDGDNKLNNDYEDYEDGNFIEGPLALRRYSSNNQVLVVKGKENPDPSSSLDRKPMDKITSPQRVTGLNVTVKSTALLQDSDSNLGAKEPDRSDSTMPVTDVLEDFDEFYD